MTSGRSSRSRAAGAEDDRGLGERLGLAGGPGKDGGLDDVRRRAAGAGVDQVVGVAAARIQRWTLVPEVARPNSPRRIADRPSSRMARACRARAGRRPRSGKRRPGRGGWQHPRRRRRGPERPGMRARARSASQPFATPSRSKRSPGSRSTAPPRAVRASDQRRPAWRRWTGPAPPPRPAARRAARVDDAVGQALGHPGPVEDRGQRRADRDRARAALRRASSESGANRVSWPAHASIRRGRAGPPARAGPRPPRRRSCTETPPPIIGRLATTLTGPAMAVMASRLTAG